MDVVLANKRPLAGPRRSSEELVAAGRGGQPAHAAPRPRSAPGCRSSTRYRKLVESGDRVLKIEGCLSGTLGFLLTEVGRGQVASREALRAAMEQGLHRARSARRPVGRRRRPQGADPRAPARASRASPRTSAVEIAGARGAARARRATRSSRASPTWTPTGRKRAAAAKAKGGDAPLRRLGDARTKIARRPADRGPLQPVLRASRAPTTRSPSPPPATARPARDHRRRRRPRGHRRAAC